jgi:hypothetical protein
MVILRNADHKMPLETPFPSILCVKIRTEEVAILFSVAMLCEDQVSCQYKTTDSNMYIWEGRFVPHELVKYYPYRCSR